MPEKTKLWLKRALALLLLVALIYFFWPLVGEFKAATGLFRNALWLWLLLAIGVQLLSYISLTWLNALALQPFSGRIGFWKLAAVLTSMAFIEVAIPSAGASGVVLRVRLLGKYGYKAEEAIFTLAVETLAELVAVLSIALFGLIYLYRSTQLEVWQLAGFILVGIAIIGLLVYGRRLLQDGAHASSAIRKLVVVCNRMFGRLFSFDVEGVYSRMQVFSANLNRYDEIPYWKFIVSAYGKVILDVFTLGACFYTFRYPITIGTLFTGYGIMLFANGIAVLPGGLGMTDAYVPVIFSWLDIPGAVALAAGLTFRLIAYWLLRFIGFVAWQFLERG
jgi:uncharacterized protein (TIRG00374 family)